jgi:hypothetical protein
MKNFSMKDPKWGNLGLGYPMRKDGCYVTSLSMLCEKTPDAVLNLLMQNDCFEGSLLLNAKAGQVLGFKTYKVLPSTTQITSPIIAETNFYANQGYPQHFFIALPNNQMVDSLTGIQGPNKYSKNIVSYRYFA